MRYLKIFEEYNSKNPIYLMSDEHYELSEWKLIDYKLQLSYKNPDEYSIMHLNIEKINTFYEIIFEFSSKNKDNHTIDIELDFVNDYFRLNNHWGSTINSLKFTRKEDFADFKKKLDTLNIEVKKLFDNYYEDKDDAEWNYNNYIREIDEDLKELCKGKYLISFDINEN